MGWGSRRRRPIYDQRVSAGLRDAVDALRTEWRLDFRVAERVLGALAGGGSVGEVVARTAADRHQVEDVLRRVEPWLGRDGERYVLTEPVDEPAGVPDQRVLAATMAEIAAGLPAPAYDLDHVPARPATMAARAGYFAERYALAGATVLCVGDHDLTSVAIALTEPSSEVLVVDIDQRILGYIEQVAAERGLPITTAFADLRLGLPASFAGAADLVFTDPPYTPDGVGLFLTRGLQGLRRSGHERIALAYGFASRQLARGFRTQAVLHELRLVLEALLPGFNRFDGAEAIGAASDLYVCRPTRFSWPVIERTTGGDPRIYSRGTAATESAPAELPESVVDDVRAALGAEQPTYVGDGWPAGGHRRLLDLPEYLAAGPQRRRAVAINLHPHFGAALPQAMLAAAAADRAVLVAPAADVQAIVDSPVWTLLAGTEIEIRPDAAAGLVLLRRTQTPDLPAGQAYEFLVRHPEAKVGNAWRDALVAVAEGTGDDPTLTKNQARAIVRAAGVPERALSLRLSELPMETLAILVAAVARTVGAPAR